MAPQKIHLIDGQNQFFLKYAKATSYQDLVNRCIQLNWGFDQVYWVFDGYDSRKPRRELYPEYKNTASRAKNRLDTTKYDMLNDFKKIDLPNHGVIVIEVPFFEADDVIRKLVNIHANGDNLITISSNDADLLDLTRFKGVTQPQAKFPAVCQDPVYLPIYKTLVGDTGDNIKGLKGFGDGAWAKLSDGDMRLIASCLWNKIRIDQDSVMDDEKLKAKLIEHWDSVALWYKLVDYIDVPDDAIQANLRIHPRKTPKNPVAFVDTKRPILSMDTL